MGGGAESLVRNLNCIRRHYGASNEGSDHIQRFQKIDQASMLKADFGKTGGRQPRQAALPIGSMEDTDLS